MSVETIAGAGQARQRWGISPTWRITQRVWRVRAIRRVRLADGERHLRVVPPTRAPLRVIDGGRRVPVAARAGLAEPAATIGVRRAESPVPRRAESSAPRGTEPASPRRAAPVSAAPSAPCHAEPTVHAAGGPEGLPAPRRVGPLTSRRVPPSSRHPDTVGRLVRVVHHSVAPLRLTARGRLLAQAILVVTAVMVLVGIAASTRASSDPRTAAPSGSSIVVRSGDTLWNIADRHVPGRDRGWVMREIRRLNGLSGNRIEVGQKLQLPAR